MSNIEKRIDAVCNYLLAEDNAERSAARSTLRRLMNGASNDANVDPESIVREIFLELGAPEHLLGHAFAVDGIMMVMENRTFIENITFGLYPALAAKFDTTASRVERAIRHLIETIWLRGDPDVLFQYFGNTIDSRKGKPTNGEFIARIANIVKMRIANAA